VAESLVEIILPEIHPGAVGWNYRKISRSVRVLHRYQEAGIRNHDQYGLPYRAERVGQPAKKGGTAENHFTSLKGVKFLYLGAFFFLLDLGNIHI